MIISIFGGRRPTGNGGSGGAQPPQLGNSPTTQKKYVWPGKLPLGEACRRLLITTYAGHEKKGVDLRGPPYL